MSSFHEVRFPARLSLGSSGGPERRTEIVTLASGFEERNTPWAHSRRRYDAGLAMQDLEDMHDVIAFFEARHGRLHGFRWKDWADYKSVGPTRPVGGGDQIIGTGDGVETQFQLIKTYVSGGQNYVRDIRKPIEDSVRVQVDGLDVVPDLDFTADSVSGTVNFVVPPPSGQTVSAGFEFDVPVRFDTDILDVTVASFQAGEIPNIPIVELRI